MILSEAYLKEREKLLEQGRQQGRQQAWQQAWQEGYQEGRRQITENVLIVRFGALDEQLAGAIASMLQLVTIR